MLLLFRKWWVLLIQGILLIILSIYIIQYPIISLAGLSIWFGLLLLANGLIGTIVWLVANKAERDGMSLLWNILSAILGLLMLVNIIATMQILIVFFGFWMLATGILLIQSGWSAKNKTATEWFMIITGLSFCLFAALTIFNLGIGMFALSTFLSVQVLLIGIALVILSFVKKTARDKMMDEIESTTSEYKYNQDS